MTRLSEACEVLHYAIDIGLLYDHTSNSASYNLRF